MSTLLVQTLYTELIQEVTIDSEERIHIGCISPYIYFHNCSGVFTFELIKDSAPLMSVNFTLEDVKTAINTTSNYIHSFLPIIPLNPLKIEKGAYTLRLSASGYSPSAVSFIGWVQQFEDVQNVMSYLPLDDSQNSLAFRVKELKEGIL